MITYWENIIHYHTHTEFDSEPIYKNNFLKTKTKSYGDEVTNFHNKEIP